MSEDDDKTRVLPAGAAAALLGTSAPPGDRPVPAMLEEGANALPAGTVLHEYRIVSTIGEGGFGVVYLADDPQLESRVAIKEYMPNGLASRDSGLNVTVRSARHQETFEAGLRSFVNEARALRRFDHPSLAKVYRFWEANGTAYMVMPFYEGVTLKEMLRTRGVPDEAWLCGFLRQLLEALAVVHHEHWYHRDIAPDNILMLAGDRPLLLDFGAARRVIGDMTQAVTVILKPGFAPLEQYAEIPGVRQGPWTDLYALAAVVHYAIVGQAPVPSVSRMVTDSQEPLAKLAAGRYSDTFLRAIDHALAVRPEARTQSVAQFAQELGLPCLTTAPVGRFEVEPKPPTSVAPNDFASDPGMPAEPSPAEKTVRAGAASRGGAVTSGAATSRRPASLATPAFADMAPKPADPSPGNGRNDAATTHRIRPLPIALGGLAALMLATGGWWFYAGRGGGPDKPTVGPPAEPVTTAPNSNADVPPPEAPKPISDPNVDPPPPDTKQASITDALGPAQLLDALHAGADSTRRVTVNAERSTVRIGKDALRFRIRSELDGYLYIFMVGTDGTTVSQLFPNALDSKNRIAKNTDFTLPRRSWTMTAGGPPGVDRFVTVVSAWPRNYAPAGLRPGKPFSEFDMDVARSVMATNGAPALTGRPACAERRSDAPPGPDRSARQPGKSDDEDTCNIYAAARFEITETMP